MIIVQAVVNWLIIVMATVLALFTLLLLALLIPTRSRASGFSDARAADLPDFGRGRRKQAEKQALRGHPPGIGRREVLSDIHGIRSLRGLLVVSETADELSAGDLAVLRREIAAIGIRNIWPTVCIRQRGFRHPRGQAGGNARAGAIHTGCRPADKRPSRNTHMQHIGLLSLCLLGAETEWSPSAETQRSHPCSPFERWKSSSPCIRATANGLQAPDRHRRGPVYPPNVRESHRRKPLRSARQAGAAAAVQRKAQHADRTPRGRSASWHTRPHTNDPRDGRQRTLELRAIIATALCSFGPDQNAETLIDLLCDREWWVRYRAAESLIRCSDTDDILRRVEQRQDRYAREMLQFALDKQALRRQKGVA